jgi:fido (protein-threonine AMPylation protein)
MPSPNEKLAESLDALETLQQGNRRVFRSDDLSRVHRERLVENGFLQEVMKGWLISSSPDSEAGESTPWHASFWEFCARYCDERFGEQWHLSPEQSLFLQGERTVIPDQLVVHSPKATNNDTNLLFGTTLYDLKVAEMPPAGALTVRDGLRLFSPAVALVRVPESFFMQYPVETQVVMASLPDASDVLRFLLNGGHSWKAGYLAKAFRQTGRADLADEILRAMKGAGYDVRESSPFEARHIFARLGRPAVPIVGRIEMLWDSMRGKVLAVFPKAPGLPADKEAYLRYVNEIYRTDAYHSLSIEGYSVTPSLVERVRQGGWDPQHDSGDRRNRDALAARGYWQAFQLVKKEVEKVVAGENPAALVRAVHNDWYRELFQPSVTAGLIEAGTLAGYRNIPVFLRGSRYIPPRWEAVRDAMPAFFDLLEKEPEPSVRAVLGHWLFGYIHPYPDGNGRMARFLMNVMLASGGYPWTVIRIRDRKSYLSALDRASIETDIHPFATFIDHRVQWRLERHDLTFPAPMESLVFGRDLVLFYGQDGEAVVRCVITSEALDHHFHGVGMGKLEVFRANRQVIEEEVRRKYIAGDTEVDGAILIRLDDLPARLLAPSRDALDSSKANRKVPSPSVDSDSPSRSDSEAPSPASESESQAIEEAVRRKYIAGDTEAEASIPIRSDDLPEVTSSPAATLDSSVAGRIPSADSDSAPRSDSEAPSPPSGSEPSTEDGESR